MKLIFKDNSIITFTDSFGISDISYKYISMDAVSVDVAKCTSENCSLIKVYDDEDNLIGTYEDMVFGGVNIYEVADGETTLYDAHFHFRNKTDVEKLTEQVAALQESQALQDGAIEDIASEVFG